MDTIDIDSQKIREYLRNRRVLINMGQDDVAEIVGVGVGAIGHWETGKRSPSLENFLRWVYAVGSSLGEVGRDLSA